MEFQAPTLAPLFDHSCVSVSCWTAARIAGLSAAQLAELGAATAVFGQRSAQAQGLAQPITDLERLCSSNHRLYLAAQRVGRDRCGMWGS